MSLSSLLRRWLQRLARRGSWIRLPVLSATSLPFLSVMSRASRSRHPRHSPLRSGPPPLWTGPVLGPPRDRTGPPRDWRGTGPPRDCTNPPRNRGSWASTIRTAPRFRRGIRSSSTKPVIAVARVSSKKPVVLEAGAQDTRRRIRPSSKKPGADPKTPGSTATARAPTTPGTPRGRQSRMGDSTALGAIRPGASRVLVLRTGPPPLGTGPPRNALLRTGRLSPMAPAMALRVVSTGRLRPPRHPPTACSARLTTCRMACSTRCAVSTGRQAPRGAPAGNGR
mmetsp:Transcript_69669/g.159793  ORF Transcript_69669/g.159793 Transcript_69669/m.159793 type:complete len:281 (-) Transcript_69669:337-1179(-)